MYESLLLIPLPVELQGIDDLLDIYEGAIPPALAFSVVDDEPTDVVVQEGN